MRVGFAFFGYSFTFFGYSFLVILLRHLPDSLTMRWLKKYISPPNFGTWLRAWFCDHKTGNFKQQSCQFLNRSLFVSSPMVMNIRIMTERVVFKCNQQRWNYFQNNLGVTRWSKVRNVIVMSQNWLKRQVLLAIHAQKNSKSWQRTSLYDYVASRNPERHVRKASHHGSKQQWRSPDEITLLLLVRATYTYFCSSRTSRSRWIIQSTPHHRRGCNNYITYLTWTHFGVEQAQLQCQRFWKT